MPPSKSILCSWAGYIICYPRAYCVLNIHSMLPEWQVHMLFHLSSEGTQYAPLAKIVSLSVFRSVSLSVCPSESSSKIMVSMIGFKLLGPKNMLFYLKNVKYVLALW